MNKELCEILLFSFQMQVFQCAIPLDFHLFLFYHIYKNFILVFYSLDKFYTLYQFFHYQ